MEKEADTTRERKRETRRKELNLPSYSVLEEVLNAVTHGVGAALAIAAMVLLPIYAPHDAKSLLCVIFYSATLFILYIISTFYHALGIGTAKQVFRVLDHCSIFLLIAGTYTPIGILMIGGTLGWILCGVIWAAAVVGVVLNSIDLKRFSKLSMTCYIGMGWAVIFAFKPLLDRVDMGEIILLLAGGIAYTVGAVIYAAGKKVKYMHSLWHLFVLAGSILHFFMVFGFIKTM